MPAPTEDAVDSFVENLVTWRESPARAMGGASVRRPGFAAADLGLGWALFNSTTLLRPLTDETAPEVLAALAAAYSPDRAGDLLLWSAWPTPDLTPFGWRLYDRPWLMRRAVHPTPAPDHGEVAIERVREPGQLTEFLTVVAEAFPFRDLQAAPHSWDSRVLADPHIRCWLGRAGGKPVSASTTVVAGGLNGVMLVCTLPAYRKRGFATALADHAARSEPALPAGLTADEDALPMYTRLGFERVQQFTVWTAPRPSRP